MVRASTTQKIPKCKLSELSDILDDSGFIARFNGEEFAIVGIMGGRLISCPKLHNRRTFYYNAVTIRKGLL